MDLIWIILLIINILLYGVCCFIIIRRKTFTCISIRSPLLLILNIFGNFLMTVIIISTKSLENDDKKICSFFYYITNYLIIIPFCLRFRRLVKCCEVKMDERLELQELYNNKYKYEEKYYIKIALIIFGILTLVLVISNISVTRSEAITAKFLYEPDDNKLNIANSAIWLGINFIEHLLLLTYCYKICVNQLKQKLRFEIVSCFIIWFIYSDLMAILDMITPPIKNDIYIYISLITCYLFLCINAICPIIISFLYKYSTSYSFTPKLANNLYIFLSNEICYNEFKKYLLQKNHILLDLLKLYVGIMNVKLGFKLKINKEQILLDALDLQLEFFEGNNSAKLPEDMFRQIKLECRGLDINNLKEDMFDEALKYCFLELERYFDEYKRTDDFKDLYKNLFLTTYIQCKMCNVGLINKF